MEKIQAEMETLCSENETLRKDLTATRSNTATTRRSVLRSVARRLEVDDIERDEENADNGEQPVGNTTTNDKENERMDAIGGST